MPKRNPKLILTEDELEAYEERAAILEYDAGMTRPEAERMSLEAIIRRRETRNTNPRKEQP